MQAFPGAAEEQFPRRDVCSNCIMSSVAKPRTFLGISPLSGTDLWHSYLSLRTCLSSPEDHLHQNKWLSLIRQNNGGRPAICLAILC